MPPKAAPTRGQGPTGARGRGGGRGRGRGRGGPPPQAPTPQAPVGTSGGRAVVASSGGGGVVGGQQSRPSIAGEAAAKAIGMNRTEFGSGGRVIKVVMNSFRASVPESMIYQYAASDPPLVKLPLRFTHELIEKLMLQEPTIFAQLAWFDGRAILYSPARLALGATDSREFHVTVGTPNPNRPSKVFKIKITKVDGEINPETLRLYTQGRWSQDESIFMATMAINTALRAVVAKKYTSNARSFFVAEGKQPIPGGLELRRGYFHSYRASISGPIINFDISTAVFYQPGDLIALCLKFLNVNDVKALEPSNVIFNRAKRALKGFLSNLRIVTRYGNRERFYGFKDFTTQSAADFKFDQDQPNGTKKKISINDYFKQLNVNLKYRSLVCIKTGKDSAVPIELFQVVPGQFAKVELLPEQTKAVVEFSTKRPDERFRDIQAGFDLVGYGQSEFIQALGLTIENTPLELDARVLPPPMVKCGAGGKFREAVSSRHGHSISDRRAHHPLDRKFIQPSVLSGFIIAIFERDRFFDNNAVQDMTRGFIKAAQDFGMVIQNPNPVYKWFPNRPTSEQAYTRVLQGLGQDYVNQRQQQTGKREAPALLFAVIPPSSADIYSNVKRFGDITMGIATQCVQSAKAKKGNHQFWANVSLKVNVKLGGVNWYPQLSADILDPAHPIVIMGADAIHPPPGAKGKPSVTAVVSSVDSNLAKYVACSRVQQGSGHALEIIQDMREMTKEMISKWKSYQEHMEKRKTPLNRLIMFRDGVSEGEYAQVLKDELPMIRAGCKDAGVDPKITFIVVSKRHHHRGKPKNPGDGDRMSGNLPAGTTIDTTIVNPLQPDYFQYTHGGLLGTSRPAHYIENRLGMNRIQALSYGLAHSFARATRSVSIPAPVYYADIVCARKGINMDHEKLMSDMGSQATSADGPTLDDFQKAYSQVHATQANKMFFMAHAPAQPYF
ncbi:eukaryotic translation initiation factor 2C 2 [Coprinopsis sp. MPI-PUGE-AT-0042]|nr:eukaryotic translation initiation factor 2C 2 [Coprinopsis sp. MPI-PUGE-AT-0042]